MKRNLAMVLIIVISVAFALPCFATDEVVITTTAERSELREGERVTVVCGIKSPVGMGGFQFDVYFDNTRLKLVNVTANKASSDKGSLDIGHAEDYTTINRNGYVRLIYIYGGSGAMLKKDDLLVMEFEVLDNCSSGTAYITPENITVGDKNADRMNASASSATIKIIGTADHFPSAEATCTQAQSCTVCGIVLKNALGHNYNEEFTVDKEATHTEEGSKSRHCSACGDKTEITVIPVIKCDIDNDGETDIKELVKLSEILTRKNKTDEAEKAIFDMNDDGIIDIRDLLTLKDKVK